MSTSLAKFSASLRDLPRVVSQKITSAAAPAITAMAKETFDASENAYGVTWEPGAEGDKVTLQKSGALARGVHYVGIGTKLRVVLSVPYAKYQIGKRPVFPSQGAELPTAYQKKLTEIAQKVITEELGK